MTKNDVREIWMKAINKEEMTLEEIAVAEIAKIENEIIIAAMDRDNSYCVEITKRNVDAIGIIENHFKDNDFSTEFVERFDPNGNDYLLIEW